MLKRVKKNKEMPGGENASEVKQQRVTFIIEMHILPSRKPNEIRALLETLKDIATEYGEQLVFKLDTHTKVYKGYVTCDDYVNELIDALGDFLDLENSIQKYQILFLYRMKG